MSTRASMSVLGLGASIEAPGIRPPFLPPTLVEFSRTLIHLEPDTKTNVSRQVIVYLHMFVVLSGELAWTLRNRAQSHVAVNFKCIFKYARSSEEVCKPQDHISPSGKPWHSRNILSWFPCPMQCSSVLATSLRFEYMDRRPASKNTNLPRQIPHSQEPSGFEYMKRRPASKNEHCVFWDGKLAEPQDIFLYVFCCDVRSDLYSNLSCLIFVRTRVKFSRAETFHSQSHRHFDTFKNVEVETYGGSKTMVKEDPAPSILQV
ncbi:hypothetical protein IW261DRAFT_1626813 [Armillaria novae-zelandiae]|uniref:Uncharacterized protein n=1 Tax=Armillaria novae-zelandiae TaxID=153914 RepID=A0AA39UHP0_9AGAR|nr:hypothetical protein IW261DRAFT_1626813 [Armillaria novae-zelandiae]